MARVKRGATTHKKREKILKKTKGFKWGRKSKLRAAKEALLHGESRAFRGRKEKKRVYRKLWTVRLNAALRPEISYSAFMSALKKKEINLDRKVLAHLALHEPETFGKIKEKALS